MKQLITLCTAVLLIFTASAQTENLGPNINSKYHEIRPTASANGNVLYFTVEGNPLNPFKDGQDIWVSYRDSNGLWGKSERLPAYINTERYNGVFWTSADGNSIMIRGSRDSSGIVHRGFSMVKKVNGMWGYPVSINIRNYDWMSKGRYTGATLSVDQKVIIMYFSDEKNSDWNDLYISYWNETAKEYSTPVTLRLSEENSDEVSPYIAPDNETLYYASDRAGGRGDFDIWMSRRLDDTWQHWSEPVNMGATINTKRWDAYFSIGERGKVAYLSTSSNKVDNSQGGTELVRVVLPDSLQPKVWLDLYGKIYDSYTKKELPAKSYYSLVTGDSSIKEYPIIDSSISYRMRFDCGNDYVMSVAAVGYFPAVDSIMLQNTYGHRQIWRDIYLTPMPVIEIDSTNKQFPCDPLDTMTNEQLYSELAKGKVLFDFGSSVIRAEAYRTLDIIARILYNNPDMKLELGGHTDAIGMDKRNTMQSEERALSAKLYLISRGVDPNRLTTKGYANSNPIAPNTTDEGRQLNRRVDFKIVQ